MLCIYAGIFIYIGPTKLLSYCRGGEGGRERGMQCMCWYTCFGANTYIHEYEKYKGGGSLKEMCIRYIHVLRYKVYLM